MIVLAQATNSKTKKVYKFYVAYMIAMQGETPNIDSADMIALGILENDVPLVSQSFDAYNNPELGVLTKMGAAWIEIVRQLNEKFPSSNPGPIDPNKPMTFGAQVEAVIKTRWGTVKLVEQGDGVQLSL